jgi:excisionase family DNA binding protein
VIEWNGLSEVFGWNRAGEACCDQFVAQERLLTTGEAAKALSIDRSTLARWQREGKVTPSWTTAGGHARWDLADLERQVSDLRRHYE